MNEELIERLSNLEKRIKVIEERNHRVEVDKTWETSWTRRILVALFTYLAIVVLMVYLKIENYWINAIVPTIAFIISTSSLPFIKTYWDKMMQH